MNDKVELLNDALVQLNSENQNFLYNFKTQISQKEASQKAAYTAEKIELLLRLKNKQKEQLQGITPLFEDYQVKIKQIFTLRTG